MVSHEPPSSTKGYTLKHAHHPSRTSIYPKNPPFQPPFVLHSSESTYDTRQACTGMLHIPKFNSVTFGLKSIYTRCMISWNKFTAEINKVHKQKFINKMRSTDIDLTKLSKTSLKETVTKHILSKYTEREWKRRSSSLQHCMGPLGTFNIFFPRSTPCKYRTFPLFFVLFE